MKTNRFHPVIATLFLALAAAACSKGSDSPAAPTNTNTNTTTISYSGVFAGTNDGGAFQLSAAVPALSATSVVLADIAFQATSTVTATGQLKIAGGAMILLTGTYNQSTKVFTMSGSSYSLTATVASSAVSGSYTGPSTSGSVSGLAAVPGVNVTPFCGTYAGTESGRWNIAISGNVVTGIGAAPQGAVQLNGTLTGATITMSWHPNATDVGNGTGTLTGTTITGTWFTNTPGDHGTWNGNSAGC